MEQYIIVKPNLERIQINNRIFNFLIKQKRKYIFTYFILIIIDLRNAADVIFLILKPTNSS